MREPNHIRVVLDSTPKSCLNHEFFSYMLCFWGGECARMALFFSRLLSPIVFMLAHDVGSCGFQSYVTPTSHQTGAAVAFSLLALSLTQYTYTLTHVGGTRYP